MINRDDLLEKVEDFLAEAAIALEEKDFWLRFLYATSDEKVQDFVDLVVRKEVKLGEFSEKVREMTDDYENVDKIENLDLKKVFG